MSRAVTKDSTDQSIRVWAYDTNGDPITGEAYNSAGIAVAAVVRSAGRIVSTTSLTPVARSGAGVHTDSAFTEVSGGEYVIDLADSYFTTAGREVTVTLTSTAISGGYVIAESLSVENGTASTGAPVERSLDDTNPILFTFPLATGSITVTRSINGSDPFSAASGTATFVQTDGAGNHWWSLSYNAADRPSAEGNARYLMTGNPDATKVVMIGLVVNALATASVASQIRDTVSYNAAALYGACADPQTAAETYTLTINGSTYTLDYTSQTSAGVRGTTTRTKT